MKKCMLLSLFLFWLCAGNAEAQYSEASSSYDAWNVMLPENISPVEHAYSEYASLIDWRQTGERDLRVAPPGAFGDAQKTVPLSANAGIIISLCLMAIAYGAFKRMRRLGFFCRSAIVGNNGNIEPRKHVGATLAVAQMKATASIAPTNPAGANMLFVPEANNAAQATNLRRRKYNFAAAGLLRATALAMTLVLCSTYALAQNPAPVPDNYYLAPGINYNLDVLKNDNLGACTSSPENIIVSIVSVVPASAFPAPSTQLQNLSVNGQRIRFRSQANFYGQIQITYGIKCGSAGTVFTSTAYVNVGDVPNFISEAECTTSPDPIMWNMKVTHHSGKEAVTPFANVLAGDVDGDGNVELVALSLSSITSIDGISIGANYADTIKIFNADLTLKRKFKVPYSATYCLQNFSLGDVNNDGVPEILYAYGIHTPNSSPNTNDYYLRAYKADGTVVWTSSAPWMSNTVNATTSQNYYANANSVLWGTNIHIVDLDGDGLIEVVAGERIFAGEDGRLLGTLPAGGRGFRAHGYEFVLHHAIGDINGDGKLEICAGNSVYSINITNRNSTTNTVTKIAQIAQPDGMTGVADIDRDGIADVVVIVPAQNYRYNNGGALAAPNNATVGACTMYVWQGSSATLIGTVQTMTPTTGTPATNVSGGSPPFIGDIDGDSYSDIAFTYHCTTIAFKWTGSAFSQMFKIRTNDTSAATTLSLFDFDNDGSAELVYRDEALLRILDKNGNNKGSTVIRSGTHTEYPIVIDVDGDGHSEIFVSGFGSNTTGTTWTDFLGNTYTLPNWGVGGNLVKLFRISANSVVNNWAAARSVWNANVYNPVYVNENLTIPSHPLSTTTPVKWEDGTTHRPFNSQLQQAGILNSQGKPLELATDLMFQPGTMQKMFYNGATDVMQVTAYVTNVGSLDYSGPVIMRLFAYNNTNSQYQEVKNQTFAAQSLAVGDNKTYQFDVTNFSLLSLPADYTWYLAINLAPNGTSAPVAPPTSGASDPKKDCNWTNNMTSRLSYTSGYVILCQDETATLKIDPAGSYTLKWLKPDGTPHLGAAGTDTDNIGDEKTVKKLTSDDSEFLLIDVWTKNGLSQISNPNIPDTVFIYQAPDTLIWSGHQDADWNNPNNWFDPNDLDPANQWRKIPRGCTNVLIPEKDTLGVRLTRYPDLTEGVSDYGTGSQYFDVRCNNIHIEHGGEVFRSDKLLYSKAFVQVTMSSNRWYCFAPPLRDFYTGDIYLTNPKPMDDNMYAFTRLFSQTELQHGSYTEGNWSRPFNTPNQGFHTGQGLGVWLDDWDQNGNHHQNLTTWYPKSDAGYNIYKMDGSVDSGPYVTSRTNSYRFAFEESIISATGAVPLYPEATSAGKAILVGNPFMAHLDWEKFYDANSTLIENYYRLLNPDGSIGSYTYGGVSTGSPSLTKLIAPMQSFIVTPKAAFAANTLTANSGMTQIYTSSRLRATQARQAAQPAEYLLVSLAGSVPNSINYAALVRNEEVDITTAYNPEKDIMKMFSNGSYNPLHVYFLTQEGLYMDVKNISDLDNTVIRIGFSTTQTGTMTLGVEKLWAFAEEDHVNSYLYDVYLYDRKLNVTVDLRRESWLYPFEKTAADGEFINDRFELRFLRKGTSIEEVKAQIHKTVVKKSYFDLSGRPVPEHAAKGLLIQKSVYDDGTTGFGKVYIK